jgi:hypothetical protein
MCDIHAFEMADDRCGDCGRPFCSECVVYAFGPKKPPLCRACAIARSGVRKHAARAPIASKRAIRKEAKQRRRAARRQPERVAADAQPISADMDWEAVEAAEPVPVAAPVQAAPPPPAPTPQREPAVAAGAVATAPVMTAPPEPGPVPTGPASIIDELPYASDDEPELREVRPSFESRLTRRRL